MRYGRVIMTTNLGVVHFERATAEAPLAVVHSLFGLDAIDLGPAGGPTPPRQARSKARTLVRTICR